MEYRNPQDDAFEVLGLFYPDKTIPTDELIHHNPPYNSEYFQMFIQQILKAKNGWITNTTVAGKDHLLLTESGKKEFEKLNQLNTEKEIKKLQFEDDKRYARILNKSVIDTGTSTQSVNRHQKINMWLMFAALLSSIIIAALQYARDIKRDSQELKSQATLEQQNLKIYKLQQSLDSMRDPLNEDTSKATNAPADSVANHKKASEIKK